MYLENWNGWTTWFSLLAAETWDISMKCCYCCTVTSTIIVDVCYLIPDAWAYRAKKKQRKRAGSGLGSVLHTKVFTQLWFVVSGVVYSGIEL